MEGERPEERAESAAPQPERPKKKITWKKRALFGALAFLVLTLLLIISTPTIITILPIEGTISRTASASIPGNISIKGISIGWFTPVRIDAITITEPDGSNIISMEKFLIPRGLLAMVTSKDPVGDITIQSLVVSLEKRLDGTANWEALIPPASDAEEVESTPSSTEEPFTLDLTTLVPSIQLPLERLGFRLENIDLGYHDLSTTTPLHLQFNQANTRFDWGGGGQPLTGNLNGALNLNGNNHQVLADLEWRNWIDTELQTTILSSKLQANLRIDDQNAVETTTVFRGGSFESNIIVTPETLINVARGYDQTLPIPTVAGTVEARIAMTPDGDNQALSMKVLGKGVSLEGLEGIPEAISIDPFLLTVASRIDKTSLVRSQSTVDLDLMTYSLRLTEQPADTGYDVSLTSSFEITPWITRLAEWQLMPPVLTSYDGRIRWNGFIHHNDGFPVEGSTALTLETGNLEFTDLALFPSGFRPADKLLDLSQQPVEFKSSFALATSDQGKIDWSFAFPFSTATGDIRIETPSTIHSTQKLLIDLNQLNAFKAKEFFTSPTLNLSGIVEQTSDLTYTANDLTWEANLKTNGFTFESGFVPDFVYSDDFHFDSKGNVDLGSEIRLSTTGTLGHGYSTSAWDVDYNLDHGGTVEFNSTIDLASILTEIASPIAGPLAAEVTGGIDIKLAMDIRPEWHIDLNSTMLSNDDFTVYLPEYDFASENLSSKVSLSLQQSGDKSDISLHQVTIESSPYLTLDISDSSIVYTPETLIFSIASATSLNWGELLISLSPYIESSFGYLIETDLLSTLNSTVEGSLVFHGEEIIYTKPLSVTAQLATISESGLVMDEVQAIEFAGLSDTHDLALTINPNDLNTMNLTHTESFQLELLSYNDMAVVEGISGEYSLQGQGTDQFTVDLSSLSVAGLMVSTEQMDFIAEDMEVAANVTTNLSNETVVVDSLSLRWGEMFDTKATASLSGFTAMELTTEIHLGLRNISDLMASFDPSPTEGILEFYDLILNSSASFAGTIVPDSSGYAVKNYDVTWGLDYTDLTFDMPTSMMMEGANGSIKASGSAGNFTLETNNRLPAVLYGNGDPLPMTIDELSMTANLDEKGLLAIEGPVLRIDNLGLENTWSVDAAGLYDLVNDLNTAENSVAMLDMIFSRSWKAKTSYQQNASVVSAFEGAGEATGSINASVELNNEEGRAFSLSYQQDFADLSWEIPGLVKLKSLSGSVPLNISYLRDGAMAGKEKQSGYWMWDSLDIVYPPYKIPMGHSLLSYTEKAQGYQFDFLSESLAGGPFLADAIIRLPSEDPRILSTGEWTSFDVSYLIQEFSKLKEENRRISIFYNFDWTLDEDVTSETIFAGLSFRMDIYNIGREVVNGMLLKLNEDGAYPMMPTALAALRLARPVSVSVQVEGGLVDGSINLTSPVLGEYNVPFLQRANLVNVLGLYGTEELPEQVKLLRLALMALLVEDYDSLNQIIAGALQ